MLRSVCDRLSGHLVHIIARSKVVTLPGRLDRVRMCLNGFHGHSPAAQIKSCVSLVANLC